MFSVFDVLFAEILAMFRERTINILWAGALEKLFEQRRIEKCATPEYFETAVLAILKRL